MEKHTNRLKEFLSQIFWPLTALLEYLQKYSKGILLLLLLLLLFGLSQKEVMQKPNLMRIDLKGVILESKELLANIEEAQKPNIKGVLFVIDSPGGGVAPSIEIAYAIKRLQAKKPVIAYAAGTLASGSYYASIWANQIIANPGSTVGSIGVIFEGANLQALLQKIGVAPQVVKAGKYKEVGTPFREWTKEEREELQRLITNTYQQFITDVAKARGLDLKKEQEWAQAHIFTAKEAQKVGLIDRVGTIYEAKTALQKLAKVKHPRWKREDPFKKLMRRVSQEGANLLVSLLWGQKLF